MRIEQVEPCPEHGDYYCPDHFYCPDPVRTVLDGFPPEAIEAAVKAVSRRLRHEYPQLNFPPGVTPSYEAVVRDGLDAAWRVLTGDTE